MQVAADQTDLGFKSCRHCQGTAQLGQSGRLAASQQDHGSHITCMGNLHHTTRAQDHHQTWPQSHQPGWITAPTSHWLLAGGATECNTKQGTVTPAAWGCSLLDRGQSGSRIHLTNTPEPLDATACQAKQSCDGHTNQRLSTAAAERTTAVVRLLICPLRCLSPACLIFCSQGTAMRLSCTPTRPHKLQQLPKSHKHQITLQLTVVSTCWS